MTRTFRFVVWILVFSSAAHFRSGSIASEGAMAAIALEEDPQALFNQGNYMMEINQYSQAVEFFRQVETRGFESGALFLNLAISQVHMDSLGMAAYYFYRSSQFPQTQRLALSGLEFIHNQKEIRGHSIPYLKRLVWIDHLRFGISHKTWAITGLSLVNLGVLLMLAGWLLPNRSRLIRPNPWYSIAGLFTSAAGILLIIFALGLSLHAQQFRQAIVIKHDLFLHEEPVQLLVNDIQDHVPEAFKVTLNLRMSENEPGWSYIRLRNGRFGWVPENGLLVL